ncbi:GntR family transcriptional regulator [Cohnella hashimotonis]|uniref:GntR family transcriptional regulator n=1 Tax=Cohnella hashimotonis TaxID=2826895 RepID=A0ABT6TBL2_9BACL|nr:GntR family transcriptional regulator [Cohnella hashimotonis]MDI4643688.1 GntR family transcriptional regulator [Cohnella hashimotonis]
MSSELFVKIRSEDLSEKVYERLKKAITTNVIKPGERIEMNTLSDQWGVSRTPVKDAIARLANEGLVEVRAKVGTYATRFTTKDMLELFAIRLLLEGGSCDDMIRHVTEEQIVHLEQTQSLLEDELRKDKNEFDYFAFNQLDAAFHEQLIGATGNDRLFEVYRSLNFHTQVARYYYDQYETRAEQTIGEHREMIEAIRLQSVEKLASVVRQHILAGQERLRNDGE